MGKYVEVLARHDKTPSSWLDEGGRIALSRCLVQPDSLAVEHFRKLSHALIYHGSVRALHSLLITSCLPGEGKTTVATNLSAVMAEGAGSPVILIDADLRRRNLTASLGLLDSAGLSDFLAGNAEVQDLLRETDIENLRVLPAGSTPRNPAGRIASAEMRGLMRQLKEHYEGSYVIIDSTPLVATSEPNVLSDLVDGVLLVVRAERTRRDMVKREVKGMDSEKMIGVVLNGAEFESSQYYRRYHEAYASGRDG